jgi:hypothetical protein
MPALKWIPQIVGPLVELILSAIKKAQDKGAAREAAKFGAEYLEAMLAGDQVAMKMIHVKALVHAKYMAIDAADPRLK